MSAAQLETAIENYLTAIRKRTKPVVLAEVTLTAGNAQTYDLTTLITEHAEFDLLSCLVTVKQLDTGVGSPTEDHYVTIDPTKILVGITPAGSVKVHNADSVTHEVLIRIDYPSKRNPV